MIVGALLKSAAVQIVSRGTMYWLENGGIEQIGSVAKGTMDRIRARTRDDDRCRPRDTRIVDWLREKVGIEIETGQDIVEGEQVTIIDAVARAVRLEHRTCIVPVSDSDDPAKLIEAVGNARSEAGTRWGPEIWVEGPTGFRTRIEHPMAAPELTPAGPGYVRVSGGIASHVKARMGVEVATKQPGTKLREAFRSEAERRMPGDLDTGTAWEEAGDQGNDFTFVLAMKDEDGAWMDVPEGCRLLGSIQVEFTETKRRRCEVGIETYREGMGWQIEKAGERAGDPDEWAYDPDAHQIGIRIV